MTSRSSRLGSLGFTTMLLIYTTQQAARVHWRDTRAPLEWKGSNPDMWAGKYWEADVDEAGRIGPTRTLQGTVDASEYSNDHLDYQTRNPLAGKARRRAQRRPTTRYPHRVCVQPGAGAKTRQIHSKSHGWHWHLPLVPHVHSLIPRTRSYLAFIEHVEVATNREFCPAPTTQLSCPHTDCWQASAGKRASARRAQAAPVLKKRTGVVLEDLQQAVGALHVPHPHGHVGASSGRAAPRRCGRARSSTPSASQRGRDDHRRSLTHQPTPAQTGACACTRAQRQ
jgi:hypothetical protein